MELTTRECPGCTREGTVAGVNINPYFFVCTKCIDDAARFLNNLRDKKDVIFIPEGTFKFPP